MEERSTSLEDAKLAVDILKMALEYRPLLKTAIIRDYQTLSTHERFCEALTARIGLTFADEKRAIPILFFRFAGEQSPIVEAFFYPYEAILSFLSEARDFAKWAKSGKNDPAEMEKLAMDHSINMTLIMLDNFHRRGQLMMDSFVGEIIAQWHYQNEQTAIQYYAEKGVILPKQSRSLDNVINHYTKELVGLWKWEGQSLNNFRKLELAENYDGIYRHWKRLSGMAGDDDWREYAKPPKFHDTPDDLLKKLGDVDRRDEKAAAYRLSELAVEHAARRAGLIKKRGVSQSVLDRRKKGLKVTGYSSSQLFEYLKEGRELAATLEAQQRIVAIRETKDYSPEQGIESALIERAKLLEQIVEYIQTENAKPAEHNENSVPVEKQSE